MKLIQEEEAKGMIKVLSREEVMRLDRNYSYGGRDYKIATRQEREAKASIVNAFDLFKSQIKKAIAMSKEEFDTLSAPVFERNRRRQIALKQWRTTLLSYKSISESSIMDAIAGVRAEEQKHEQDVTEKLEDIFDPAQRDLICRLLMGELRVFHARIPFVSRQLKLSMDQVSLYEACRLAQKNLVAGLSARFMTKHR